MFEVVFHIIKDGKHIIRRHQLERVILEDLPHNIVFITVEDDTRNNRFIFILKNRANIRNREKLNVKEITIFGEDWEWTIPCDRARAYIANLRVTIVMLKIMKETRSKELKKYNKRIGGFAEKKKIPCFNYYEALSKNAKE